MKARWVGAGLLFALSPIGRAWSGADHSRFQQLLGPFPDGPAVTRSCLSCHTEAGKQLAATSHWQWLGEETTIPGRPGKHRIGKKNLLNNFCIGIQSNEASCSRCHIGYGWKDKDYDFTRHEDIDCLVCHDTTGDYVRRPAPDEEFDFAEIAQSVGKPGIDNCGTCHFRGGGGESVKHGDLDPSLSDADRTLDVHMGKDGLGFVCADCHRGVKNSHDIRGRSASVSVETEKMTCAQCHGDRPHGRTFIARNELEQDAVRKIGARTKDRWSWKSSYLNAHAAKVACQTCHIPRYAKRLATKTHWDWSKTGRLDEKGEPVHTFDKDGNMIYAGIKGAFRWGKNLAPEYAWYNGTNGRYLLGDTFDPPKGLVLNPPVGGPGVPGSKIWPFKIHRATQIYDATFNYLIQPKLSGEKGSGAYWKDFDWDAAARKGMEYVALPFSGKYGFAATEMYWPLSHMVVEGEAALGCADCHDRKGRLAALAGVYLPGQHRSGPLDAVGWSLLLLSILGVSAHGLIRAWGPKWLVKRLAALGGKR